MGHNIQHYDYPENVDQKKVFRDLANYVQHEAWQEGGHLNEIRWLDAKPLPSRDDAEEFLNKHDKGWYDCLAVRYLEADRHNPTRAYIALLDRRLDILPQLTQWDSFPLRCEIVHQRSCWLTQSYAPPQWTMPRPHRLSSIRRGCPTGPAPSV